MVTPEMILQVKYEVGDVSFELPMLSTDEYTYFLSKNQESIRRASLDAAKTILFKLSLSSGRKTVDILSIDNTKAASSYREALMSFIKNPELNGSLGNLIPYAGGISKSDIKANEDIADNNAVILPVIFNSPATLVF